MRPPQAAAYAHSVRPLNLVLPVEPTSVDRIRYSWLNRAGALLLRPFAPLLARLSLRWIPVVEGVHVLVCSGDYDTLSGKVGEAVRLIRDRTPRRFAELQAHVRCIHIADQRLLHGRFDRRLRSLRLDTELLKNESIATIAAVLALGSFAASLRTKGLAVSTCSSRHHSALRSGVSTILQSLGVVVADAVFGEPTA